MTDKVQKIREKVEKLKSQLLRGACSSQVAMETRCKEEAYNDVLGIFDTMQEEPVSENLEKEIDRCILDEDMSFEVCAHHFANWQKEKDEKEKSEIYDIAVDVGRKLGEADMKQQMMAKAVDVTIAIPYQNSEGGYTQLVDSKKGLPFGDNIKVLVIKED